MLIRVDLGKDATKATVVGTELYSNSSARIEHGGGRRLRVRSSRRAPVHVHWHQCMHIGAEYVVNNCFVYQL